MKLVIERTDDAQWLVWAGLDGEDPSGDGIGFVIGSGPTRPIAIDTARADLAGALRWIEDQACGRRVLDRQEG